MRETAGDRGAPATPALFALSAGRPGSGKGSMQALQLEAGGECYAVARTMLLELVRLEGEAARCGLETVRDVPVYRLRGRLVPLVDLRRTPVAGADSESGRREVSIAILQAQGRPYGLVVDRVLGTQEIVAETMRKPARGSGMSTGTTADGRKIHILDSAGIAARARLLPDPETTEKPGASPRDTHPGREKLLLLRTLAGERVGVRLSEVTRLEEFEIGQSPGRQGVLVPYRGSVLPLFPLTDQGSETHVPGTSAPAVTRRPALLIGGKKPVGFLVHRILDVVDVNLPPSGGNGVPGAAVVGKQAVRILDLSRAAEEARGRTGAPASPGVKVLA